jgi:glycogen debranching enzyme
VWPWLLGFYVEAALRAAPQPADGLADGPADGPADGLADAAPRATPRAVLQATLRAQLAAFDRELEWGGLNHINEVYDGAAPHRRGGTFAQAWSTAEILRALALLDGRLPL